MSLSRYISIFFTVVIVVISYLYYYAEVNDSYIFNIRNNLKSYVFGTNSDKLLSTEVVTKDSHSSISQVLFTASELSQFTGIKNDQIYLSIFGKIFDVTKGKKHYGAGGSYHGFAGKDASKAFVTGDFTEEGLIDDIRDLSLNELGDIQEWVYKYEKDYEYKGKLIGRFYDESGNPTVFLNYIQDKLSQLRDNKQIEEFYKKNFPPCNAEWSRKEGTRLWCTRFSGGVERDWVGVPRKFHQPGTGISRCACVNVKDLKNKLGSFHVYENCHPSSVACTFL